MRHASATLLLSLTTLSTSAWQSHFPSRPRSLPRLRLSSAPGEWPAHTHRPWTIEDDALLWERRDGDIDETAALLQRGRGGVAKRLSKLNDPESPAFERFFAGRKKGPPDGSGEVGGTAEGAAAAAKLRPAKEVLLRITWDPQLEAADFVVGYTDRFKARPQEVALDAPNDSIKGEERRFVEALPEHRIAYFKWRRRVVWDRHRRLDRVFGSGRAVEDKDKDDDGSAALGVDGGVEGVDVAATEGIEEGAGAGRRREGGRERIEDVMATYDRWLQETRRREQSARERAIAALGDSFDGGGGAGQGGGGSNRFGAFKRLSKRLLEGDVAPEAYAITALSEDFFGPTGNGLVDGVEEENADQQQPALVALIKSIPEEHYVVKKATLEAVAARLRPATEPAAHEHAADFS